MYLHEVKSLPKLRLCRHSKSRGPSRTTTTKDQDTHFVFTRTIHAHNHLHRHIYIKIPYIARRSLIHTHTHSITHKHLVRSTNSTKDTQQKLWATTIARIPMSLTRANPIFHGSSPWLSHTYFTHACNKQHNITHDPIMLAHVHIRLTQIGHTCKLRKKQK